MIQGSVSIATYKLPVNVHLLEESWTNPWSYTLYFMDLGISKETVVLTIRLDVSVNVMLTLIYIESLR